MIYCIVHRGTGDKLFSFQVRGARERDRAIWEVGPWSVEDVSARPVRGRPIWRSLRLTKRGWRLR